VSSILLAALLAAPAPELIQQVDTKWAARTPKTRTAVAKEVVKLLEPHAGDFEVDWRLARAYVWQADAREYWKDTKSRSKLGKKAMKAADRARKAKPKRPEGHFYYTWGVGQWSLGISIVKALVKGAEGMYKGGLKKLDKIDKNYECQGSARMWARFYYSLPWPKRDLDKAIKLLRKSEKQCPKSIRGRFFLAEALIADGEEEEACKVVDRALKVKPDVPFEPDWPLWKRGLKKLKAKGCDDAWSDL